MITLITTILGALTGMVPGILNFFIQKANNAQQIALEQLRQQGVKDGTALQIDLADSQSDIQQQQHLYSFAGAPTGIKWVDGLTALVRPIVTFVMFDMWLAIEVALLIDGIRRGYDLTTLAALVWTPATEAIFGAIMGFWFGNRMLVHGQQQMAATLAVSASVTKAATVTPNAPARPPARPLSSGVIPEPPGSRT